MTANQIAFNRAIEDARHNVVMEDIEHQKARAAKSQADSSKLSAQASMQQAQVASNRQIEDARHNLQDEEVRRGQLAVSQAQQKEIERYNRVAQQLNESALAEQAMHNRASESASFQQARAANVNAAASAKRAEIESARQAENERHNLVAESIEQQNADTARKRQTADATESQSKTQANYAKVDLASSEKFKNYLSPFSGVLSGLGAAILGG